MAKKNANLVEKTTPAAGDAEAVAIAEVAAMGTETAPVVVDAPEAEAVAEPTIAAGTCKVKDCSNLTAKPEHALCQVHFDGAEHCLKCAERLADDQIAKNKAALESEEGKVQRYCRKCHRDSQGWADDKGKDRKGDKRERKGDKRDRKGGNDRRREGGWVPSQEQVEEHLAKVLAILKGIKARNTDRRDNTLRYDFSAADALFDKAKTLYGDGKFGYVKVGEGKAAVGYEDILDFLYQGVLAKANRIVAEGKLDDVSRIVAESQLDWKSTVANRKDGTPVTLAEAHGAVGAMIEEDAEQAAADAHEVLKFSFQLRDEADKAAGAASRADFLRNLGADEEFIEGVEKRGSDRRGGGRRGGRSAGGPGGNKRKGRLEPYSRPRQGGRDRTTIGDYVGVDED